MKINRYIKVFLLATAVLLVMKILFDFGSLTGVFSSVMNLLTPFVLGFIIAFCINIPVSWFEKKLKGIKVKWVVIAARPISIVVTLLVLVGFIVFGLMSLIPMIIDNAQQLVAEMPGYINSLLKAIKELPFPEEFKVEERISAINVDSLLGAFESPDIPEIAQNFFSGLVNAFLTLVATLYFLAEYNDVKEYFKRLIKAHSPKRQRPILKYVRLIESSFRQFLTCQFIDCLVIGTITMIALTIMGERYAVTLGLLLGLFNMIPYFGAIFGVAISVFVIWANSGLTSAIAAAITLVVLQQIDGNFIGPKIMGSSFKISPVLVIIAITVGGAIGGPIGMLFAIPVANIVKTVSEEYIQTKEKHRTGNNDDKGLPEPDDGENGKYSETT